MAENLLRCHLLIIFLFADHDGSDDLGLQLIKTQDTIPIHSAVMSQKIAINSLDYGEEYTLDKIDTLKPNREQLLDALSPLGTLGKGIWGGDAIYFFARLPKGNSATSKDLRSQVCRISIASLWETLLDAPQGAYRLIS